MSSTACSRVIAVSEPLGESAMQRLRSHGQVIGPDPEHPDVWRAALDRANALIVRTYTHVTAQMIARAPELKVIGRAGVGLENIDLVAARDRGIQVVYTPAAATRAVAELTIGLILALQRRIMFGDHAVRCGQFLDARRGPAAPELAEQTIGIVGMGRIGRAVGRICSRGFGMKVIYNDIVPIAGLDFPADPVDKPRLYSDGDIISLHVPLTKQTRNLINRAALDKFKPNALLINTARGAVVDSAALAESLARGTIAGAALDVFDPEPLPADHPLLGVPNCLLSPHIGARTRIALAAMNDVVDDVIAVLEGRAPAYPAPLQTELDSR